GDTGPAGLGIPGAGPGVPVRPRALRAEGSRGWWEAARAGLSVSPCPGPAGLPPCPGSRYPHVPVSPQSLRPPGPPSLQFAYPQCSHSLSPVSPRCPHTVSPCPQAGLARCQREAEEVAELMRQNVARALEREGRLEQLQSRAQDLRKASEAFTRTTQTVTQRQRRRQQRWHLVALGLGLLLLFILALALVLALARPLPGTITSTVPTPRGETKHPPSTVGAL
ncbi:VAMP5 protein, partial [Rhipidura dahli]|nr:VAMP5 protein [Rhipidura dahli]